MSDGDEKIRHEAAIEQLAQMQTKIEEKDKDSDALLKGIELSDAVRRFLAKTRTQAFLKVMGDKTADDLQKASDAMWQARMNRVHKARDER